MKFLFVHQNFPAQFVHLLRHLVRIGGHELVFITEPNPNHMRGVRKVPYVRPRLDVPEIHIAARELDNGVRRAETVYRAAAGLDHLGFKPDIIIGHHGWGEMLNLPDVWPSTPMLGYMEFYYQHDKGDVGFDPEFPVSPLDFPRIRAKNAINHIALNLGGVGQTPTQWQLSTYPDWARSSIELVWEGVDLDICSPDPAARRKALKVGDMTIKPTDKLVTYVSRDLEPYRGFHIMMRALPHLMRARKDIKVVMIGGDGVSYGNAPRNGANWREVMLAELGSTIDRDRVAFPGRVPYELYRSVLRRSDAHVYLTYPFVASWSLRESLAMGCAVIGADTEPVSEFITHGQNGLLTPCLDPKALAGTVLNVLEDKALSQALRQAARAYAERHLKMSDYLDNYCALIERMTGQNPAAESPADQPAAASKASAKPSPPKPTRAGAATGEAARQRAARPKSAARTAADQKAARHKSPPAKSPPAKSPPAKSPSAQPSPTRPSPTQPPPTQPSPTRPARTGKRQPAMAGS